MIRIFKYFYQLLTHSIVKNKKLLINNKPNISILTLSPPTGHFLMSNKVTTPNKKNYFKQTQNSFVLCCFILVKPKLK